MNIALTYEDRAPVSFPASAAYSVLVAIQRAGYPLRHDCGGKALCGTCRVELESGSASPIGVRERERLDACGAADGTRLACQMHPASDLRLKAVLPLSKNPGKTA